MYRGISIASRPTKHHDQSSPGCSDRMIGWLALAAWALLWRFRESSQQPM
jgi:hypothetical protein